MKNTPVIDKTLSSGRVSCPLGVGDDYPGQQQRERPNVTGKRESDASPAHPLSPAEEVRLHQHMERSAWRWRSQ